jgi:hypothetical protein
LRLDQLLTAKTDPILYKDFYSGPLGKVTLHGSMLVEALLLFEPLPLNLWVKSIPNRREAT